MIENKGRQFREEVKNQLAELISKNLNIPVYVVNNDTVDQIFELVKQLPEIEKKYSPYDLHKEISQFVINYMVIRPKNDDETNERLKAFLRSLEKKKSYEATILLPGLIDFPIGTKIGPLEIIEPTPLDPILDKSLKYLEEKRHIRVHNTCYAKIEFEAYTSVNVRDVLFKALELPLGILSLIALFDLDARNCAGMIKSPDISAVYYLEPQSTVHGWSRYRPDIFGKYFDALSEASLDKKPNQLRKKMLQAIQVFGLSRLSHKPEIRFLLLVASFESLLLTENDRDYLGKKLSEKTAFLLESTYEKRLELYKLMSKFYGKRSGLVHRGESEISEAEVEKLEHLFRNTVFRVLELSKEYTKMEQKSHEKDKEGIEDFLNKLRFS